MINHYSTPPHEEASSMKVDEMEGRTLPAPSSHNAKGGYRAMHPLQYSPCNSRRGSLADAKSPPMASPPHHYHQHHKPTPLDHRPDLTPSAGSGGSGGSGASFRRDSLPSITQLTSQLQEYQHEQERQQKEGKDTFAPPPSAFQAVRMPDDQRRHSIAVPSLLHASQEHPQQQQHPLHQQQSMPAPSNASSTCSSPQHPGYATPPLMRSQQHHHHRHSTTSLHMHSSSSSSSLANSDPSGTSTPTRRMSSHTPYSRSPELRVSHKLAERKRRKEMKDLFDDLRDLLPLDKGLKTSKWEILSKAVMYIGQLHDREQRFNVETEQLRNELRAYKQL
ncbi:hypothetical protein BC940DRAFT_294579 [Gongronella butleri]|nr:hypothetical protein BC940DRAFT_294579 [Gongronella butleri]